MNVVTTEPTPPIWWIVSYPKSGNTWLRALFTAYLTGRCEINNLLGFQDTDRYAHHVTTPTTAPTLRESFLLRPAAILHLWHRYDLDGPLFIKSHCANTTVDGLPTVPVQLCKGVIYLTRDPRCVAPSYARHMGCTVDDTIEKMAARQRVISDEGRVQVVGSWSANVTSWLDASSHNVHHVRYEDLRDDPANVFASAVEHVMGTVHEERVERAVELADIARLRRQEGRHGFVGTEHQDRFFGDAATDWRGRITPDQAVTIERQHGAVMARLGYRSMAVA